MLLADDEENQLRVMERFLRNVGYDVLSARDGPQALEIYRRHHDAIIVAVLDFGLPKVSGWETYRAMRAIDPTLMVLFASGYVAPELKDTADADGSVDVVKKPYAPEELIAKIDAMLERSPR